MLNDVDSFQFPFCGNRWQRRVWLLCQHGGCLRAHLPAAVGSSLPNARKSKEEFDTTEGTQQVGTCHGDVLKPSVGSEELGLNMGPDILSNSIHQPMIRF